MIFDDTVGLRVDGLKFGQLAEKLTRKIARVAFGAAIADLRSRREERLNLTNAHVASPSVALGATGEGPTIPRPPCTSEGGDASAGGLSPPVGAGTRPNLETRVYAKTTLAENAGGVTSTYARRDCSEEDETLE